MRLYVHHGAPSYDPELFQAVSNGGYHNKPKGGLWLSPVDAEKGWENWCQLADLNRRMAEAYKELLGWLE